MFKTRNKTKLYKLYQKDRRKLIVLDVTSAIILLVFFVLYLVTKKDYYIFGMILGVGLFFASSFFDFLMMSDYKAIDNYLIEVEKSKHPNYASNKVNELKENLTEKQKGILECWKTSK